MKSKIIKEMKPKSGADYDKISYKLLIQIGDIIVFPLNNIVNQSLYTGIFSRKPKLTKLIPM